MTWLKWHGRNYAVEVRSNGIFVGASSGTALVPDYAEALRWLTSRALRKGKARQLLAAAAKKR